MFNILIIGQAGRLQYEAALLVASLRHNAPNFSGRVIIAEPRKGPKWSYDPRINDQNVRDFLTALGAEIIAFESKAFGENYPHGNKIEGLKCLPKGEPFLFLDSDTFIKQEIASLKIDFSKPTASLRRTASWPHPQLYHVGYKEIWGALYDQFDLDFESSQDKRFAPEHWERYLYFNAGWFYGHCPQAFGQRFTQFARKIKNKTPEALAAQSLDPWLDQVALPLVIHSFGGGREGAHAQLDGTHACHYRTLPLLFARESDETVQGLREVTAIPEVKKVLKSYEPFKKLLYHKQGQRVRDMFDRNALPHDEKQIRQRLKRANLWIR